MKYLAEFYYAQVLEEGGITALDATKFINVGAVLCTPRACMQADTIASKASFIHFNVEDLTSSSFATSRQDSEKFLPCYLKESVFHSNPYKEIDEQAVGKMMQFALKGCRSSNKPEMECSVVEGDQTGDPRTIRFLHDSGKLLNFFFLWNFRMILN
jgi:pyruvate,orthophosphate dikinase